MKKWKNACLKWLFLCFQNSLTSSVTAYHHNMSKKKVKINSLPKMYAYFSETENVTVRMRDPFENSFPCGNFCNIYENKSAMSLLFLDRYSPFNRQNKKTVVTSNISLHSICVYFWLVNSKKVAYYLFS